jgi:Fic family protein
MKERFPELDALTADLRRMTAKLRQPERENYQRWMEWTWIHHDSAIEGVVTQLEEVKEALSGTQPSDSGLVPVYDEIRAHREAIRLVQEEAARKAVRLRMTFLRDLYALFSGLDLSAGKNCYRRDIPIHRLYFHDIAAPERIGYRMKRLVAWADSAEFRKHHAISAAILLHYQFMEVFPFPTHSGKIGRLIMNLVLMNSGYDPVVIHASDRHRYYESLRGEPEDLAQVVEEAMENSLRSWAKILEQRRMLDV